MDILKSIFTFLSLLLGLSICLLIFGGLSLVVSLSKGVNVADFSKKKVKTERAIGVVELNGEISSSDDFRKNFEKMIENEGINSIVVRIDSPGGAVGAAEEIYRIIAESEKPTVCSLGNVAASGGLYAAVACDEIYTNLGTITGSIGVILMMPNISKIADEHGFKMNVVKSGQLKDAGSPFKEFGEGDRNFFQGVVDQSYEQFVKIIADNRKLSVSDVKKFADGRIILGEQAVKLGLADKIGGLQEAAVAALKLSKPNESGKPELVFAGKNDSFSDIFEKFSQKLPISGLFQKPDLRLLFM